MNDLGNDRRVLLVTSNYPRWDGDSTTPFVLHLAQDLRAIGWDIHVLAPHAPGAASREVLGGVPVDRFRYLWPESQETVCYGGGALINLRKSPVNYAKVPALIAAEWRAIGRRLRSFDLVHSHWLLPQGFTAAFATRTSHVPHVATVHGGDVFALSGGVLSKFKRFALRHADAVTVNSSATAKAVAAIAPDVAVHTIAMGVDTDVAPDPSFVRAHFGDGPLVVFVGRVIEEKGIDDLLDAVASLPDVKAIIIGEGQDRTGAERRAADLGLSDRVAFRGWIEPKDVPSYIAAADVFVAPSRRSASGWMEAQGLSIAEAMVVRTPVVATDTGGISDTVIEGETGLLVAERSPELLAAAIKRILSDRELGRRLAANAFDLVVRTKSRRASADAFSKVFDDVLCAS